MLLISVAVLYSVRSDNTIQVFFPCKSLLLSVSSPKRHCQIYTACGTLHSKNFPTKILMYHNEGNMSRSIHLQSTYKNHHSVPIEYLSVSYSSMARDISLFHGNANWQVKIRTTLESIRKPSFRRSLQHLTAMASICRDNTAKIVTVNVFVVQRDRWHSLALHVGVKKCSRVFRRCASWHRTIYH